MTYNLVSIGHNELRNAFREIYRRSRQWHHARSNWIHKKLLEACMDYTKNGFRITNGTILSRIRVAFKELRINNRRIRILLDGETKALEMQVQYRTRGVFKWAPKLETWLQTEGYKFWLGIIQRSLTNEDAQNKSGGQPSARGDHENGRELTRAVPPQTPNQIFNAKIHVQV